jgi:hypothetical protein
MARRLGTLNIQKAAAKLEALRRTTRAQCA